MFDHPDLVAQLVPYLTPKDMAHCIATCKAFASIFEPYLYRQVTLVDKDPAMSSLPRHLQHVRILEFFAHGTDKCLLELAMALNSAKTTPAPSRATSASTTMINLRKFTVNTTYRVARAYSQVALDTIISVLDNNSGLTHLELQTFTDLPDSSIDPRLLDVLRTGLPRLQRFIVSGGRAFTIVQAMDALKICLGHPRLTDVQFYTGEERRYRTERAIPYDQTHFDSLLRSLSELDKAGMQLQGVYECRLMSLALPYIKEGYPRSFLLPLLRTYLPQLERFEVPFLDGPYESELEEVIVGHCRNLQHVSYTFPSYMDEQNSSVIKAVIRGCGRWSGLKSIRIFGYNNRWDSDSGSGLVETLVEHHSKTLESVEIKAWKDWTEVFLLKPIFTGCPNLKSFKVLPNDANVILMYFFHTPADPWVFQGIKELHLHFYQLDRFLYGFERAKQELDAGEMMFKQIGKLVHLEALALDHGYHRRESLLEWGLDESFECKWVKELAGLDKLRYLYIPQRYLTEEHLSTFIDSIWPLLERVSTRCLLNGDFQWLKARRPWLKIGDLEGGRD